VLTWARWCCRSYYSADKASGYRTVNILCMPIKSVDGTIVGVLQAINKKDGSFTLTDEDVMSLLATQAGIALQNANLFRNAESARDKFRSLLDIIRAMQGEMGVNSLIFTITQRTIRVVDADRCTLYLVDNVHRGLFAMQGEVSAIASNYSNAVSLSVQPRGTCLLLACKTSCVFYASLMLSPTTCDVPPLQVNIRISMDQGIAGMVATTGQTLNIPDAYENDKFNQAIDKKTGYRTRGILCMPIKSEDQVIGVLQLINKVLFFLWLAGARSTCRSTLCDDVDLVVSLDLATHS
jgi:adenylate cyclase